MKNKQIPAAFILFGVCLLIYFSNGRAITSTDDVTTTLLAFNWLENHQLSFDFFRDNPSLYTDNFSEAGTKVPRIFIEASNGHISSKYPIGASIVAFPVYAAIFLFIKISNVLDSFFLGGSGIVLDLMSKDFLRSQRILFETIAATTLASFSVVIFYTASKLKFGGPTALISSFIFGFSTSTWAVCSQGLRQHGVSNLLLIAIILALLKANRSYGKLQCFFLVLAGFFAGLLHASRPTSLLFLAAIAVYCIYIYRKKSLLFILGTSSILMGISWNIYYFGISNFLKGGYAALTGGSGTYSLSYFPESAIGLLISPNRGWIVLCPILLFAFSGVRQSLRGKLGDDEKLFVCLFLACTALYVHYWFYKAWSGVFVYGPSRFLIDILPVFCFLINYFIYENLRSVATEKKRLLNPIFCTFLTCLVFSTFVQALGAFGNSTWSSIPTAHGLRLWDVNDSVIERTLRGMIFEVREPIQNKRKYVKGLNGSILELLDQSGIPATPDSEFRKNKKIVVKAEVKNTGTVPWYGYESGPKRGLTRIATQFTNVETGKGYNSRSNILYVEGVSIEPGEQATAIGDIKFPRQKGWYDLELHLESFGYLDQFTGEDAQKTFRIHVQ